MEELRLDDLNLDGLKLYQYTHGYGFTSDSVILSNFIKTKKSDTCVEIGTGSGIISVLVCYKNNPQKIYAFEMQNKYCELAQKNIDLNNMQDKIQIIESKVQDYKNHLNFFVDVVFCNPPYYKSGVCKVSNQDDIAICKHEKFLPLNELIFCASKMLKFGGKFFFVYPANRLDEVMFELNKNKLQPKRMFFVQPNQVKNANTVFIECIKGGKNGVTILPTLVTNSLDGDYVQTIQKLYKNSKEIK